MSMSQEEIESLMNGLDIDDGEDAEETISEGNMSEDDINKLISQTEEITSNNESTSTEESIDDLLNSLENTKDANPSLEETNIDDILKELEESDTSSNDKRLLEDVKVSEDIDPLEDSILSDSDINNFEESISNIPESIEENMDLDDSVLLENGTNDIDNKINNGLFPLPVGNDTKVVNQLSEVASDSEEKATKIFDVLSNILDYNSAIQNDIKILTNFNEKQIAMLTSLSQKFPGIDIFQENLNQAEEMENSILDINEKLNDGNTEIFQAMELMQYHDINRQKIERVMSVIRKLSSYLNNLFEDEGNRQEVNVANHIHGDSIDNLVDDEDLESLIAEFNKEDIK